MTDKPGDAQQQFEALVNSANHLNQLRAQLAQAQERHVALLNEVLDAAEANPSQLTYGIVHQKKAIAGGPLSKPTIEMLRAIGGSRTSIPPGGGAGCPDKVGCANIGQLGDRCFYLCKTVTFNG